MTCKISTISQNVDRYYSGLNMLIHLVGSQFHRLSKSHKTRQRENRIYHIIQTLNNTRYAILRPYGVIMEHVFLVFGGGGGGGGGGITTRYHERENVVRFKTFFELVSFYNSNSETSCAI